MIIRKERKGFTLIELVMVIAILGALAAIALPKFKNLKPNAQAAALSGIAGAFNAANEVNVGVRSFDVTNGSAVGNCTDIASLLSTGSLPSGYTVGTLTAPAGDTVTCTVTQTETTNTETFRITGIN